MISKPYESFYTLWRNFNVKLKLIKNEENKF